MIIPVLLGVGAVWYLGSQKSQPTTQSAAKVGTSVSGTSTGVSTLTNGLSTIEKLIQSAMQKNSSSGGRPSAGGGGIGAASGGGGSRTAGGGSQSGFGQPSEQVVDATGLVNETDLIDRSQISGEPDVPIPDVSAIIAQSAPGSGADVADSVNTPAIPIDLSLGLPGAPALDPGTGGQQDQAAIDDMVNQIVAGGGGDLSVADPIIFEDPSLQFTDMGMG